MEEQGNQFASENKALLRTSPLQVAQINYLPQSGRSCGGRRVVCNTQYTYTEMTLMHIKSTLIVSLEDFKIAHFQIELL